MARIAAPDPAMLSPEQRLVHERISAGPRGGVRGPLAVWLHRPELADRAQALGEYCRYGSALSSRLSELAILVTARAWGSEYEWFAHRPLAEAAGLEAAIVEAIRTNAAPVFGDIEAATVYEVAGTLHLERRLSAVVYANAVEVLGQDRLIDLIGLLGYYTLISMTINAFEVDLPPGAAPAFT